jgi:general L-amino acid transport system permease protein
MAQTTVGATTNLPKRASGSSVLNDPRVRGIFYQIITAVILIGFFWWVAHNTAINLARNNQALGYGFIDGRAGFNIGQTLIDYSSDSTYGRAFVVGIVNTLYASLIGIVIATVVGFIIGIGRLSHNWLISRLCTVYVEFFRNIPPLLVIFFWYYGVLNILPQPRDSVHLPFGIYVNVRGVAYPRPVFGDAFWIVGVAFLVAIALAFGLYRWSARRQAATGKQFPIIWASLGVIIGLPLLTFFATGMPVTFDVPVAGKFNLTGGAVAPPEFMSLLLALSFYTASFIAEIVRGGIRGVAKGQSEAAGALGLRPAKTMRLVIVPQALRIIIPPLSSQYLNLTKNTSLATAIGYADLFAVGKTVLNQTGKAIEVVTILIVCYLFISILQSLLMNWFNAKMALVER